MPSALLTVRVTPRASQNEVRLDEGVLHVRTTAVPVNGSANKEVIRIVAHALGVRKSSISIKSGETGRIKVIEFNKMDAAQLDARLYKAFALERRKTSR